MKIMIGIGVTIVGFGASVILASLVGPIGYVVSFGSGMIGGALITQGVIDII